MRRRLYCVLAFALLFSVCLAGQNVFVLPSGSSSTVTVFGADPFSQLASLNVTTAGSFVLPGPNGKFYIVSNVGNGNPTVAAVTQNADGTFSNAIKNVGSFSGALAAQISSDGRHLVVQSSGGLNVIDTSNDTVLTIPLGGQIIDFAISLDSSRIFVVNSTTNTNQVVSFDMKGTLITQSAVIGTPTAVAVGPTGRVYVSTSGALLELDPVTLATTHNVQVTGRPGKLSFTPDGNLGIAINLTPTINGTSVFIFDLNKRSVVSSIPNSAFTSAILNEVIPVSNNRAIGFSSTAQAVFDITLNPVNAGPFSFAPAGTVNSIAVSNDVAAGAHTGTQFLFFNSNSTLYRFDLLANQITGQQTLPGTPGAIAFAAQPITNGVPAALITYGDQQTITLNSPSAPFGVRVVDANGRPLAGVTVTFGISGSGLTLSNTSVVTDNNGIALISLTATVAGSVPVTVTVGPLNATITVNVGGGPTGPSQSGCLTILGGQGQVAIPQFPAQPLIVQCVDTSGNPEANQNITFTIVSSVGAPNAQINSFANGIAGIAGTTQTVPTDPKTGQAQVVFINPCGIVNSFGCPSQATTVIQATAPDGSVVTFYVTTAAFQEQADVDLPPVISLSSGSKKLAAITARVSTADPGISPTPIPNVGLRIINPPGTDPARPVPAKCDGSGGFALSALLTDRFGDTSASITCDLIATGPPGNYVIFVEIGGNLIKGPISLTITPGSPAKVTIVGGDQQSGNPGQRLANPLIISVTDASGNVLPGVPVTFSVVSGAATLSNTSITTDTQGRAITNVTLGGTPGIVQIKASAGNASQTFSATVVTPVSAVQLVSGSGQSAVVNAAFTSPVVVKVVDSNGNGVPGITVSFLSSPSGAVTTSTPQVTTDAQGNASAKFTAGATPGPAIVTAAAGAFSATAALIVLAPGPANLVFLNGAGFQQAISPGAIVAIQGTGLTSQTGVFVPTAIIGPLPTSLQGITVSFNGVLAPIFSVSNQGGVQQVVVQVPFETTGASASVTITTSGGGSTTVPSVPVQPFAPGIFETAAGGQRQAVATHPDGSYVIPANPAHKGENITIYLTGLGQTTPSLFTNSAGVPNQRVNATVAAGINNVGVPIVSDSSGKPMVFAAPGLVGVYTLTLQVPSDAPSGNVPLNVTVFDASNNQYLAQGSFLPIQ